MEELEKAREAKEELKKIKNEFEGRDYIIQLQNQELTALCPFTANPDFYEIKISYQPDKELIELKSLKLYLQKFRDIRITHESLLNIIFEDIDSLISPKYLKIELNVNIRGGIKTTVIREKGSLK